MEKYTPSEEDVGQAKERMSKTQEELTKDREKMFTELEKMGKTGYLEIVYREPIVKDKSLLKKRLKVKHAMMTGTINNHSIYAYIETEPFADGEKKEFDCIKKSIFSVDNKEISPEQGLDIFNKFKGIAIDNDKFNKARKEVGEEAREYSEKEEIDFVVDEILS
jgi:hypothetical protein